MSKSEFAKRHSSEAAAIFSAGTETKRHPIIMKYTLLNHLPKEHYDRSKEAALMGAWKAYVEAIQASGVLTDSVGLQLPETATMVSVRNGKRRAHAGPYAETQELLGVLFGIAGREL